MHRKYADVQALIEGEEILEVTSLEGLETAAAYDAAGDVILYRIPAEGPGSSRLVLRPGLTTALFPSDTPTVANGLGLLGVRDPSVGNTGPGVRALMPELGPRVGVAGTASLDTTSPGAAGFLTNGSIRDIEGLRAVPLACWAAGGWPMHGALRWVDVNSPAVIDGMTVRPGASRP